MAHCYGFSQKCRQDYEETSDLVGCGRDYVCLGWVVLPLPATVGNSGNDGKTIIIIIFLYGEIGKYIK